MVMAMVIQSIGWVEGTKQRLTWSSILLVTFVALFSFTLLVILLIILVVKLLFVFFILYISVGIVSPCLSSNLWSSTPMGCASRRG